MTKTLTVFMLVGASFIAAAQTSSSIDERIADVETKLTEQMEAIERINTELDKDYWTYRGVKEETNNKILQQRQTIDSLNNELEASKAELEETKKNLSSEIKVSGEKVETQFTQLDGKSNVYLLIAILASLVLVGLIYWLLGKRITASKTDVETQIRNTKASLEEESVKLDNKLVEVLETQLKLQQEAPKTQETVAMGEADHSLALKVADEVIRIQKNLSQMDDSTRGLKQLSRSVKSIMDNLAANGYELVDMLGKEYNEGMKATVNFVQDESYTDGQRTITRIIKPQVNYKGAMIQTAQIEVTEA